MNTRFLKIAVAALVIVSPIVAYAEYNGPTAQPPSGNTPGSVWLNPPSQQVGLINVNGQATFGGASSTEDINIKNGKAISVPYGGSSSLYVSNYGSGASGFTMNLRGNLNLSPLGGVTTGILTVPQICLNSDCRTSWPTSGSAPDPTVWQTRVPNGCASGSSIRLIYQDGTVACETDDTGSVSDIWVNTTGDTMTGNLTINNASGNGVDTTGATYGVSAAGTTAGGYFKDAQSTSEAYAGYGVNGLFGISTGNSGTAVVAHASGANSYGVSGYGSYAGAYFNDYDGAGNAYIGYGSYALLGNGNIETAGSIKGTNAAASGFGLLGISTGNTGTAVAGNASGANSYGVTGYGAYAGGYFYDYDGAGSAFIGYDQRGIDASGNEMGGYFSDKNSTGKASVASGDYGIQASGNTIGGMFTDSQSAIYSYLGYDSYSLYGNGSIYLYGSSNNIYSATMNTQTMTVTSGLTVNGAATLNSTLSVTGAVSAGGALSGSNLTASRLTMANGFYNTYGTGNGEIRIGAAGTNFKISTATATPSCSITPGAGATWSCSSDGRLKKDISELSDGLNVVMKLKPSTFTWKDGGYKDTGFIAQDVQEVIPSLVTDESDEADPDAEHYLSLSQVGMIPYMVKAIQELKEENDSLKARIEALESK